ncbi:hypothetical protein B0H13DRAFT_2303567 [Mycena leptocephala]|nr:hypothetical protein B0H13DRAFT_2303567 [Mycena leptocephala]
MTKHLTTPVGVENKNPTSAISAAGVKPNLAILMAAGSGAVSAASIGTDAAQNQVKSRLEGYFTILFLHVREEDRPFDAPPLPRCARGVPQAGASQVRTLKPRSHFLLYSGPSPLHLTLTNVAQLHSGYPEFALALTPRKRTKPVPFKRATGQSIGFGPTNTAEQTDAFFTSAAGFIGCPASGTDAMPCLRNAPLGAIVSAINRVPNGAFAPVIEGPNGFLPDLPSKLITAGKINNAKFVGGHCTGDGKSFAGGSPETSKRTTTSASGYFPDGQECDDDLQLECTGHRPLQPDSLPRSSAYIRYQISTIYLKARSKYDEFEANIQSHRAPSRFGNAGNAFTPFHTSEAVLAKETVAYWTSFAATGNPSTDRESISPTSPASIRLF